MSLPMHLHQTAQNLPVLHNIQKTPKMAGAQCAENLIVTLPPDAMYVILSAD